MTFDDKKELVWAAAYGAAFASRMDAAARVAGEEVFSDRAQYGSLQLYACKVADAAVKDLIPGWRRST